MYWSYTFIRTFSDQSTVSVLRDPRTNILSHKCPFTPQILRVTILLKLPRLFYQIQQRNYEARTNLVIIADCLPIFELILHYLLSSKTDHAIVQMLDIYVSYCLLSGLGKSQYNHH